MLGIFKKIINKNNTGPMVVSTATMTDEQYIKAVEGEIHRHWVDEEILAKTGISDLFANDIVINKNMSYEDICDCLNRVCKMVDMATYVSTTFCARSKELGINETEEYKKHLDNVMNGTAKSTFRIEHDFYSADTIRDLFIEAKTNVDACPVDTPVDADDAMKRLVSTIKILPKVQYLTFAAMISHASVRSTVLRGFSNN